MSPVFIALITIIKVNELQEEKSVFTKVKREREDKRCVLTSVYLKNNSSTPTVLEGTVTELSLLLTFVTNFEQNAF